MCHYIQSLREEADEISKELERIPRDSSRWTNLVDLLMSIRAEINEYYDAVLDQKEIASCV